MFYDENFEESSILLDSVVVLKTLMGAENAKFFLLMFVSYAVYEG